jgi:hypothetical protein
MVVPKYDSFNILSSSHKQQQYRLHPKSELRRSTPHVSLLALALERLPESTPALLTTKNGRSLAFACAFTEASQKPDHQHQQQRTHRGSLLDRNWNADALSAADEDRTASWIWPWPRASRPRRRDRMHMADLLATHHKDRIQCQTIRLQATRALEGASRMLTYRLQVYLANTQLQRQRASRACEVREQSNSFCTGGGQVYLGTEDQSKLYQLLIKHHLNRPVMQER